jgi:hypothetical protein
LSRSASAASGAKAINFEVLRRERLPTRVSVRAVDDGEALVVGHKSMRRGSRTRVCRLRYAEVEGSSAGQALLGDLELLTGILELQSDI